MHSFTPLNSLSGPAKLDNYTHDPELAQDPIQIGDYVKVHHGPHRGLRGRISWIQHPVLWVYPLAQDDDTNVNTEYEGLGPTSIAIHVDHAHIDPPATLKFSSHNGYNVTMGNLVRVVHGKYYDMMGIVLSVDFCKASMEIQCNGFCIHISFSPPHHFLITFFQLHTLISLCSKESNWTPLLLHQGQEVWVIAGDKKGRWAHLVALGCQSSIISMLRYPHFEIKNTDIVTRWVAP